MNTKTGRLTNLVSKYTKKSNHVLEENARLRKFVKNGMDTIIKPQPLIHH
jgi:hypothetical protein